MDLQNKGNNEAALRECEKALSLWRYTVLRQASGEEETKDGELETIEDAGSNEEEKAIIGSLKVDILLRIASYNIKLKDFPTALSAC